MPMLNDDETVQQTITIQQVVTVEVPADKVIIDRVEYEQLKKKADMSCWWTLKEVAERYQRRPTWFVDNILMNAEFEPQLRRKIVMYDGDGGRGYLFEPNRFSEWMRDHFREIADQIAKK